MDAFDEWASGRGYISAVFADHMRWEIVGLSRVSTTYADKADFVDRVLAPFGERFSSADPFRPTRIRAVVAEDDTVVVVWDGRGTTTADTVYENTYAWVMRVEDGLVVDGTAFFDSIAFDALWELP